MNRKYYLISAIILIVVTVLFIALKRDNEEKLVALKANVVYSDKKFIISNNDSIDFIRATISIDKYYKLKEYNFQSNETYTIWQNEFIHENGNHYPDKRKPIQFAIWCETKDGKNGFYSKKFK